VYIKSIKYLAKGFVNTSSTNELNFQMYKLVMPGVCYVVDYVQGFYIKYI